MAAMSVDGGSSSDSDPSSSTSPLNMSDMSPTDQQQQVTGMNGLRHGEGDVFSTEDMRDPSTSLSAMARSVAAHQGSQAGRKRAAEHLSRSSPPTADAKDFEFVGNSGPRSPDESFIPLVADATVEKNKRLKLTSRSSGALVSARRTSNRDQEGRLLTDRSKLPAEIWTHICTYTPPSTLASLCRVNRRFHSLLDPSVSFGSSSEARASRGVLALLSPGDVWASSRNLYFPQMPKPLQGRSEPDMWRLICGQRCESCGKSGRGNGTDASTGVPWEPALGKHGVKIIWPFGIRSCGECLEKNTEKVRKDFLCGHYRD